LDKHGVPVYKIIDPIDTKIPSFALVSLLVLLGVAFLFLPFTGIFAGPEVAVTFLVVDPDSAPLPKVPVQFTYQGRTETLVSDTLGEIVLNVAGGTRIDYEVDTTQWEVVRSSFTPSSDNRTQVIALTPLQSQSLSRTIKLVNTVGQPVLNDAVLTFACSSSYGTPPSPISGIGGVFTVTPNADCGELIVTVEVTGYETIQSFRVTKEVQNIILSPRTTTDATIFVTVKDQLGAAAADLYVSAQRDGIEVKAGLTDAGGSVSLGVAAGTYTMVVSDPRGIYTSAQQTVSVGSGDTASVTITVTKEAAGTLNVRVQDKLSQAVLRDAIVKLKQGNTVLQTTTTNASGEAVLSIPDRTLSYTISASKEDYIPAQQSVLGSTTSTLVLGLEKFDGMNGAVFQIQLKDQDDVPVADAAVILYNADTGFLAPYEQIVSDANGVAKFKNVVTGNYTAFAYKAGLTALSGEHFFAIDDPATHTLTMIMEIPDGTVSIRVVDNRGNPIPFAKVTVFNAFKNQLLGADLTDTNGMYILPRSGQRSKADKDVFLVVQKTDYATVTTIQKPILPETTQRFEVVMPPLQPRGSIQMELVGLFDSSGKIVTGVGKGREYQARFRISIPEEQDDLDTMDIHVRTGEKDIVEKDEWYVSRIAFPRTVVVKGSSWDPQNGLNSDGESITFDAAKWVNAVHRDPQPGIYEFEVTLSVRDNVAPQETLKLFYKVRAENGDILRDPSDANPVEELYAATKSATYQVGVTTLCDKEFCFDASILDLEDQRIEDAGEQFNAQIFNEYNLTFNLLNNGTGFHTNANLRIGASNEGIDFTTYDIFNADNARLSGTVNDNQFRAPLGVGNLTPQKKVGGTIQFIPRLAGSTLITFELVSDFSSVFSRSIQVNITGDKDLRVDVTPSFYPSNIPITLDVHAENSATGDEVEGALVTLENNLGIVIGKTFTDAAGNARITLPAQAPGKKIFLKVEKAGFNPAIQELAISGAILAFDPEKLGISINAKTQIEKTTPFTITNQTSLPLRITRMKIQGNLQGLLDKEKIESALLPYVGNVLPANGLLTVNLRSVLTPEARQLLEHVDLDAVLEVRAESYGTEWVFDLPLRYGIGISAPVDDPTCFNAVPRNWETSSDGDTVTYEFRIQNNCSIGGNPISLRQLAARADWSGNELGEIVLSVFKQDNPTAIGAAKIRTGYFSPFLPTINPQESIIARLDFTPYGGVKGNAKVDIVLQAENPQEGKPQLLTSTVVAALSVVNLRDCVIYDKEILDLRPGEKDSFTIETKGCGSPVEVGLQTDLEVTLKQFTLQGDDKKTIEVNDNQLDPGQYPIYVNLEGNEDKVPIRAKTIRARIRDPNACLQLNRYEFDVFDDPNNPNDGFDTARLENHCTQQKVKVRVVIEKKFLDSLKKGLAAGVIAFLGTAGTNWLDGKDYMGRDKVPEDPAAAATTETPAPPTPPPSDTTSSPSPPSEADMSAYEYIWGQQEHTLLDMDHRLSVVRDRVPETFNPNNPTSVDYKTFFENALLFDLEAGTHHVTLENAIHAKDVSKARRALEDFDKALKGFDENLSEADDRARELWAQAMTKGPETMPSTGLVLLLQSNPDQRPSTREKIQESAIGSALGKITGKLSLGTQNPWVSFGVVTIAVSLIDYFGSGDKEFNTTVLGKDVEIEGMRMIAGEKGANEQVADKDIRVTKSGVALVPKINLEKETPGRVEADSLTFTNISQFVNQTIFRTLLVFGERFEYASGEKYKNKVPDEDALKAQDETEFKSKFHLQYNAIPPESRFATAVPPIALSCDTFSEKTGKTGDLAVPKVAFKWNFTDIPYDACDAGRVDKQGDATHIYCDATQFSIATLQKVQTLRQFITQNAPFACPVQDDLSGSQNQIIPAADIGISSIAVDKIGGADVNIVVGIQNKAPAPNNAQLRIEYKAIGATTNPIVRTQSVFVPTGGSQVSVGFVVSNLSEGAYTVTAILTPEECENCFNSQPASDSITTEFFIGANSGLVACEPFTTLRLGAFIKASEDEGKSLIYPPGFDKDSLLGLVNYRAHLMQDRFSPDFFQDFDRYATTVSFFDAPTYYLDPQTGLRRFFTNRDHWIVQREGSVLPPEGYLLPGPGIYDVTLDIRFDEVGMPFFTNGEVDAVINVLVEKTSTVEEISPFYYLPFNGLIGTDDGQGRVGYGVNYTGEKVKVNMDLAESVDTIDIADSTPVTTLTTKTVNAYPILNSIERGTVLSLTQEGTQQLQLTWSPSFATPVMMRIANDAVQSDVYGFYSVGVGNDTSQSYIGAQGNPWYGVGPNCRDFADNAMLDHYSPRFDMSAINADCALTGAQENIAYGFEWCANTIHAGNTFFKS
ncbi:MAG: carboxypeptidase-like regulatory domain-containing protein, partial [archaeon]|nr:carboxypeptidase-like regulatory domain-containing protein [archaeon]